MSDEINKNFEASLDEMIHEYKQKMADMDARIEGICEGHPDLLLRYKNAMFKLDKWIEVHPLQMPPSAEYFLK